MDTDVIKAKLVSLQRCMQRIRKKTPGTSQQLATDFDLQDILILVLPGFPWVTPVRNWPGRGLDRHRRSRWLS